MSEEKLNFSGDTWTVNSEQSLEYLIKFLRNSYEKHRYYKVKLLFGKQRTLIQNSAMHVYHRKLSQALNEAGFTVQRILTRPLNISWTPGLVKEILWRGVQSALFDKKSTVKLTRQEMIAIYDELHRHLIETHGIDVAWPQKDIKDD